MGEQTKQRPQFTLGVNYWPGKKAMTWWRQFDRGEVSEEFARIQAMGLGAVRIFPLWDALQPESSRLNHKLLDQFGLVLDQAADAGLQVLPVLLTGLLNGVLWLPGWMVADMGESGYRIAVNGRILKRAAPKNFFGNRTLNQAQILLARELIGYFAKHPALWGWELGQRVTEWVTPPSPAAAQDWIMALAEVVRSVAPGARLAYTSGEAGLTGALHIHDLAEAVQVLGWMVDPGASTLAESPLDVDVFRLGSALLRGLAGRDLPVMLCVTGIATSSPGEPGRMLSGRPGMAHGRYLASESEQAEFVRDLIEAAWEDQVSAVWLPSFSDYAEALWSEPPLDLSLRARTAGLLRADGSEKPVVGLIRSLAERIARGELGEPRGPRRHLRLDPDAYYAGRITGDTSTVADSLAVVVRRWRNGGD